MEMFLATIEINVHYRYFRQIEAETPEDAKAAIAQIVRDGGLYVYDGHHSVEDEPDIRIYRA